MNAVRGWMTGHAPSVVGSGLRGAAGVSATASPTQAKRVLAFVLLQPFAARPQRSLQLGESATLEEPGHGGTWWRQAAEPLENADHRCRKDRRLAVGAIGPFDLILETL